MAHPFSPSTLFGDLPLLKLKATWSVSPDTSLPHSLGSAWRGLVGWELRRLVCPFSKPQDCKGCVIASHCPYYVLMEKDSPLPGLADAPRGYIFHAQPFTPHEPMELHVTLLGTCTKFFPVLHQALVRAQASGLGASRNPFRIEAMELVQPLSRLPLSLDPREHPLPPEPTPLKEWIGDVREGIGNVRLEFLTPLRLRRQGKNMMDLDLPFFLATLARRLEALDVIFNDGERLGKTTWQALEQLFSMPMEVCGELSRRDQSRYSNRQKTRVPQGGLVGKVSLPSVEPWMLEWLTAAEHVHVGKGASMGLGCVRLSLPDASAVRSQSPTPRSQAPTPHSQAPTPHSQAPTPRSSFPSSSLGTRRNFIAGALKSTCIEP